MCMLIYCPRNAVKFTWEEWQDFHQHSPNGWGMAWQTDEASQDSIAYYKGLDLPDRSWKVYQSVLEHGLTHMVLHWRYATAGVINYKNCHPIEANPRVLMFHNGPRIGPSTPEHSDSYIFATEELGPALTADPFALYKRPFMAALDRRVRRNGDRVIVWDRDDPDVPVILGAGWGWHKGRWYSNGYAWDTDRFGPRADGRRKLPSLFDFNHQGDNP